MNVMVLIKCFPFAWYCINATSNRIEDINYKSIQVDGLLRNAIFYDNHIITIDLINKKFGIMEVEP